MNILYIHQYFKTPDVPGGTRSYWNCVELIKNGHNVTMLCGDRDLGKRIQRKTVNGIDVISIKVPYSNKMGIFKRLISFLRFMFWSTWVALRLKKIDLVFATSTPLTVGFPALLLKKLKGINYIFEVRDLWPEVPIQMGALKNKLLIKITRWFEKSIYKNAMHIIALSPGMQDGVLDTGMPNSKVSMIPNMAKIDEFFERQPDVALAKEMKLDNGKFKLVYFGALGLANAIDYILETAYLLKPHNDIEIVIIGYGAMESLIEKQKKEKDLSNLRHLGVFNMETTSAIVNICDLSLVTFDNIPILATNSPNKLFDSLSAGKPIIVNSPGWTKDLVEHNNCGIFVDPTSPQDFADKVIELKNSPDSLLKMGKNSRKLAESTYDKSILCEQMVKVVEQQETKLNLSNKRA